MYIIPRREYYTHNPALSHTSSFYLFSSSLYSSYSSLSNTILLFLSLFLLPFFYLFSFFLTFSHYLFHFIYIFYLHYCISSLSIQSLYSTASFLLSTLFCEFKYYSTSHLILIIKKKEILFKLYKILHFHVNVTYPSLLLFSLNSFTLLLRHTHTHAHAHTHTHLHTHAHTHTHKYMYILFSYSIQIFKYFH